jgi:hypothetical protein
MGNIFPSFFVQIWNGFKSVPVFDLGFSFASLLIGIFVITIGISILYSTFSLGHSIKSRIGRNARNKRNRKGAEQ